jgi:hypothetical protein
MNWKKYLLKKCICLMAWQPFKLHTFPYSHYHWEFYEKADDGWSGKDKLSAH